MAISPFRPGSLSYSGSTSFVSMRRDMTELQRQLQTGQKSDTFGGLGFERRTSLDLRSKLSAVEGYKANIESAELRIKIMTQNLERLNKLGQDMKSDVTLSKFDLLQNGRTFAQNNAEQRLKEIVDLMNSDIAGRSLFAGRAVDRLPMEGYDRIMNGDGARAGLKTMIAQRVAAETGYDAVSGLGNGMGRLSSSVAGAVVTLTEEVARPPYGFKITGASGTGGVTAAYTAGAPAPAPPANVTFTAGAVGVGDTITVELQDQAGNKYSVTLTASNSAEPADALAKTFQIGADANATAANINAAIQKAMKEKATTELQPRAAMQTAKDFFAAPGTMPPRVVGGPPYHNVSAPMVTGTTADTLVWYTGETAPDDPRITATVRVDQSLVVGTGARASEPAIQNILAQLGVMAAESFTNNPVDAKRYTVMTEKVFDNLSEKSGNPKVSDIATEIANAATAMKAAKERHRNTETMIFDTLDNVEGVSKEEVGVSILELQNRLQASYQTTSMLSRLSLVNYL